MIMISNFLFNFTNFCAIVDFLTKLVVSVVLIALTFLTNSSYTSFLTTYLPTTSLNFFKSTGRASNLPISNLSIFNSELAKSTFLPNLVVSTPVFFLFFCFFVFLLMITIFFFFDV